jgi:hypothetical protein
VPGASTLTRVFVLADWARELREAAAAFRLRDRNEAAAAFCLRDRNEAALENNPPPLTTVANRYIIRKTGITIRNNKKWRDESILVDNKKIPPPSLKKYCFPK